MTDRLTKPLNLLKAVCSYLSSCVTGSPVIKGMPLAISAELTNNCNLRCPHCLSGADLMTRERGFMEIGLFRKVLREMGPYLFNLNLYFQGEPMMHPLLFAFLESCRETHTVISTNGHYLSEENSYKLVRSGLNKLIVSLDGTDQETYSQYRVNGDLSKVIDGLKRISYAKKKVNASLKIEIQFLVNSYNEHQVPFIKKMAESLNVSLKLKSMQITAKEEIGNWLPIRKKFGRYKIRNGEYVIKSSQPDRCARLWFNPVITWDGKVLPCCFDKDAEFVMGDLNNDSFSDIWDGPRYRTFRKSILTGRHMIEICRNCTSGLAGIRY